MDFRQRLLEATNEEEFKRLIIKHSQELAEEQQVTNDKRIEMNHERVEEFEYVSVFSVFFILPLFSSLDEATVIFNPLSVLGHVFTMSFVL